MKKEWKQPELTVLVRTRPEEAILGGCKIALHPSTTPSTANNSCVRTIEDPCDTVCSLIATS